MTPAQAMLHGAPHRAPCSPWAMNKIRILTVDDDPHLSALVKVYLERTAIFEVQEVNIPNEALAAARAFRPHAILLDVFMPGKDGRVLAKEISEDPLLRGVHIMFLTAEMAKIQAKKRDHVVSKRMPFVAKSNDPKVLVAAVCRLLQIPSPSEFELDPS
jgi:CheY-like chemotaxis protein